MADDGSGGKDPFDFVLDETFVSGASMREAGWKEREAEKARQQKAWRKRGRKDRNRRRLRRAVPVLGAVALLAVAAVLGFGVAGQGPLASLKPDPSSGGTATATTTTTGAGALDAGSAGTAGSGGTTTTSIGLTRRSYDAGSCVLWDQDEGHGETRETRVVPCDEPHLMEMVSQQQVTIAGSSFPSDEQWSAEVKSGCTPPIEKYLGRPLDPHGRYHPSAIQPSPRSWAAGDRELYCGISQVGAEPVVPGRTPLVAGKVDAAAQQLLYPIGACLTRGSNQREVSCAEDHTFEVVGQVDVTGLVADVPVGADESFWRAAVGTTCEHQAAAWVGRFLLPTEAWTWFAFESTSWRAGARIVQCGMGRTATGDWIVTRGSLKHV